MDVKKFVRNEILNLDSREYATESTNSEVVCDLSLNINPYGVSEKVVSKLKSLDNKKINHYYTENKALIKEIARYIGAKPEQILLGDGCDGCLQMIVNTFISCGDSAVIPVPTFHRYEFHTRIMGGNPIFVPTPDFKVNPNSVLEKAKNNAKMIFLCNPNNPTGISIEKEVKEEIIKNFDGIVVVDEALADATNVNGTSLIEKYDNLIIVRSFSKTFGLASLRIGYIVSNTKIIEQIRKTSSPFKVNGIAQELAIESLKDKKHIEESKEFIKENRYFLISNLEKLGFKCTDSVTTNFLVNISKITNDSSEFVKKLKSRGVFVTDAKVFRMQKECYIRLSISSERENHEFIRIMHEISKEN